MNKRFPPQGIYEYITQKGFIPYMWDISEE